MAGHSLTYLRLAPTPSRRAALLQASGHSYLEKALAFAPALALVCALYWLAAGFFSRRNTGPSALGTAAVLSVIQILGFGGQEVMERLLSGAPLHHVGSVLLLGVPVQLMVAGVAALVVTALKKAGEVLGNLLNGIAPFGPPSASAPTVLNVRFTSAVLAGGPGSRGPPVLSR